MTDREKVIKKLAVTIQSDSEEWDTVELPIEQAKEILALLKEQEAVEPEWRKGTPFCGNCGHRLEKKNRNIDGINCPSCGRSVKWE